MKKSSLTPSPFGHYLGCKTLGDYSEDGQTYTCTVTPGKVHINNVPTVHGGYMLGLLDECFAMLIFRLYGNNSAVTIAMEAKFVSILRQSEQPITCQVHIAEGARAGEVVMEGEIRYNNKVTATARTTWALRKRR